MVSPQNSDEGIILVEQLHAQTLKHTSNRGKTSGLRDLNLCQ